MVLNFLFEVTEQIVNNSKFAFNPKKDIILVQSLILKKDILMISDQIIAVSEFRKNPTKVINEVSKWNSKYIFIHNKPKAVLVDVDWFENASSIVDNNWVEYVTPDEDEIKAIREYEEKKKKWELEFVEAFSFLDSLEKTKNV